MVAPPPQPVRPLPAMPRDWRLHDAVTSLASGGVMLFSPHSATIATAARDVAALADTTPATDIAA